VVRRCKFTTLVLIDRFYELKKHDNATNNGMTKPGTVNKS